MHFLLTQGDHPGWCGVLESPARGRQVLAFEPLGISPAIPDELDGLAGAFLPTVMKEGGSLRIRGTVTGESLRNLTDLAESWANWRPGVYKRVTLTADRVIEPPLRPKDEAGVFAWSGSLRSSHTLVRHLDALVPGAIRPSLIIRVLGLRGQEAPNATIVPRSISALQPRGTRFACVRTNARDAGLIDREMGVLPIVAAALHLAGGGRGTGVHARNWPFAAQMRYPRPGPALPDLYSGGHFSVRADGGGAAPSQMVSDLLAHPDFAAGVSGCARVPAFDAPCGRCAACTVTALACHAWGLPVPSSSFAARIGKVAFLPFSNPEIAAEATSILEHWRAGSDARKSALTFRVMVSRFASDGRDVLRWLTSATRIQPIWPR